MSRSKVLVPEAREALNRFKMEAANEVGVLNTSNNQIKFTFIQQYYILLKRLEMGVFRYLKS